MEDKPLVSIIIPVFNVRPYLVEALDSMLCQSYKALEILLIDDGSTDGSGEICDEYFRRDGRIRVVHQENRGISAARNRGLDMMTGDLVSFLDPDDCFESSFMEKMVSAMLREGADLAVCRFATIQTEGDLKTAARKKRLAPDVEPGVLGRAEALRSLAAGSLNSSVWNKLYRRSLWADIRFPEGHVYEDIDTFFRILDVCSSVFVLDLPLYLHRKRSKSVTATPSENNIRDYSLARTHFESFVEANTPDTFPPGTLEAYRWSRLRGMLKKYIAYSRSEQNRGAEFGKALRAQIIAEGKAYGSKGCTPLTWLAFRMLCLCPGVLVGIFPGFRVIRSFLSARFDRVGPSSR